LTAQTYASDSHCGTWRDFGNGRGAASAGGNDVRPALVFVSGPQGPEPRRVLLGMSDWDYTEVLEGVQPGERLVLMSVARLQQQQQDMMNRMRQRSNIFPSTQQQRGGGGR
jgi:HlyD family secretion protein